MKVLTIVTASWEEKALARWGARFALAHDTGLRVARFGKQDLLERMDQPTDDSPFASIRTQISDEISRTATDQSCPLSLRSGSVEFVQLKDCEDRLNLVLEFIRQNQIELVIVAQHSNGKGGDSDNLALKLLSSAPCHTIVIRVASQNTELSRILAPTAGGPHAAVALRLAYKVAKENGAILTPLYIEPNVGEIATKVGERILEKTLRKVGIDKHSCVEPKVLLSNNVASAIAAEAAKDYDLVIIGASDTGSIRRLLFGTIPERLLEGENAVSIAVCRSKWPFFDRFRAAAERWLDLRVPQLNREERQELFETIQVGSSWNFDFLVLIFLSTAIATLGLIQNSTAVVIGAMLVAPLMTPLLGIGLSIVQGNLPLLRSASYALSWGLFVAGGIGFLLGLITPITELTSELAARGGPTILDIGIGFFSGMAAAYCLGRPQLSAALPGVAIAAALLPPIATFGVSLSIGAFSNAYGAALLFLSNVVAIILGAALSLFGSGVASETNPERKQRWSRWITITLLISLMILALTLGSGAS